jgi:hypothetical protein
MSRQSPLRLFLDSNVVTGGIVSEWGLDKAVLSLCAARICRMVLAEYVREEVEEVRDQRSEVKGQKSEFRSHRSEVKGQGELRIADFELRIGDPRDQRSEISC